MKKCGKCQVCSITVILMLICMQLLYQYTKDEVNSWVTMPKFLANVSFLGKVKDTPTNLMYFPSPNVIYENVTNTKDKKLILLYPEGYFDHKFGSAKRHMSENLCEYSNCKLMNYRDASKQDIKHAAAIVFSRTLAEYPYTGKDYRSQSKQVWIYFSDESPAYTRPFDNFQYKMNWTATYRQDSTIQTKYFEWLPFPKSALDNSKTQIKKDMKDSLKMKNQTVFIVVSNCKAKNNRLDFVKELKKYINVDVYGKCGKKSCPRFTCDLKKIGTQYKFYLSFENSNCREYITEKFYKNALQSFAIPIVMGAPLEDYQRLAPSKSFIHVDEFESANHLAKYLKRIDRNDTLFMEYQQWRYLGVVSKPKSPWCDICAKLNEDISKQWYENFQAWISPPGICNNKKWKKPIKKLANRIEEINDVQIIKSPG